METCCDMEATPRPAEMHPPKDPWMLDTEPLSRGPGALGKKGLEPPSGPLEHRGPKKWTAAAFPSHPTSFIP